MEPLPLTKISHAAAWTSDELSQRSGEWVYRLTESDLRELDQARRWENKYPTLKKRLSRAEPSRQIATYD